MANVTFNIMMGLRKRAFERAQQQQQQTPKQEKMNGIIIYMTSIRITLDTKKIGTFIIF